MRIEGGPEGDLLAREAKHGSPVQQGEGKGARGGKP